MGNNGKPKDTKLNKEEIPEVTIPDIVMESVGGNGHKDKETNDLQELKPKHPGGRPTIEENEDLQLEYIRIHHLRVVLHFTYYQIAKALNISVGKAKKACAWVRSHWEMLDTQEYLADAEELLRSRMVEMNKLIDEAKAGEPIILNTGEPLVENGQIVRRVDKDHLRSLIVSRRDYERMLLDVRGLFQKTQLIISKNAVLGDVNINMEQKREVIDAMSEEDQNRFLELCDKYGKPPDSD